MKVQIKCEKFNCTHGKRTHLTRAELPAGLIAFPVVKHQCFVAEGSDLYRRVLAEQFEHYDESLVLSRALKVIFSHRKVA